MNIPNSRFFAGIAVLLTAAVCVTGCDKKSGVVSKRIKNYVSSEGASEPIFNETENTVTLNHDFGVLIQPVNDEVTCEFEITNNTEVEWNLKQIVNTCSCSIADMTSTKVRPGKSKSLTGSIMFFELF